MTRNLKANGTPAGIFSHVRLPYYICLFCFCKRKQLNSSHRYVKVPVFSTPQSMYKNFTIGPNVKLLVEFHLFFLQFSVLIDTGSSNLAVACKENENIDKYFKAER